MMKFIFTAAVLAVFCGVSAGHAQSLRNAGEPSEFPPASYKSKQYVDSSGCAYVRAGIDGAVTWVPRVARNRKQACGFKPSLGTAMAKAPAAVAKPVAKPVQITVAKPVAKPVAKVATARVVAKPAPKAVVRQAQKTVVMRKPIKTTASITTMPKRVVTAPAPRVIVAKPAPVQVVTAAPAKTRVVRAPRAGFTQTCRQGATQNTRAGDQSQVRCGPQASVPYYSTVRSGGTRAQGNGYVTGQVVRGTTQGVRVAPRHVYEQQQNVLAGSKPPPGYQYVWEDDRLNTHRAHQTLDGKAQMDLIWTRTVPRQLINRATGRNVTAQYPTIIYPDTTLNAKPVVSTSGKVVRRVKTQTIAKQVVKPRQQVRKTSAPQPKATGKRYVQVATFGVEANARKTANRLAGQGLPVRMGNLTRGNKTYRLVLVGPLSSSAQMKSALSAVRRAGFKDAFIR